MAMATTELDSQVAKQAETRGEVVQESDRPTLPRWLAFGLILGVYLTLRGYHSFDGDQAYRLPLLIDRQDPSVFGADPFVRAFDAFNPHQGYLALIDWASRPFGLATALAALFLLTFTATARGVDSLARSCWPESGVRVGWVALALFLLAKGGNVGTNHLFEATLLDRLVGFGLGWMALATTLADPRRGAWAGAAWLGLAGWVHPSVGLQVGMTLGATWGVWSLRPGRFGVSRSICLVALGALGLALAPALAFNAGQAGRLFEGLPAEEFRTLAVLIQGPQHMLPSSWRASQWLAWGCYPVLACLALGGVGLDRTPGRWPAARVRLVAVIAVNLASLALAYLAVEVVGNLRATVFQPFRMATLARGLALIAASGRVVALWGRGDFAGRARAGLIALGLSGDWSLVVATAVDFGMATAEWAGLRRRWRWSAEVVGLATLAYGLVFLIRHDTESGHLSLLGGLGLGALGAWVGRKAPLAWNRRRVVLAMAGAWAVPLGAMIAPWVVDDLPRHPWAMALVGRCRFAEVPVDDLERLASWCREQTPASSRFIGPPGPKTFRLWSRRPLAFNRSASPYHAEGLADWARRYREHVGFEGSTAAFSSAYLDDYHALESGYGRMTDAELAGLARRQGATHVLVASARPTGPPGGPLERLRVEGRYAVERVVLGR